jgi:hypothetical protein
MVNRFLVVLLPAFILFYILGAHRAEGQISPDPKLIEEAKKEREMIFYTTMTLDQSKRSWTGSRRNIHSLSRLCSAQAADRS